jgi:hypothetical protein
LIVSVVGQFFAAAVGIGDEYGQVVAVVAVLGSVLQRIDGLDDVAALIVVVLPQALSASRVLELAWALA